MFQGKIEVRKLTDLGLIEEICQFVFGKKTKASLKRWYQSEHSPIYSQFFFVKASMQKGVMDQLRTHEKNGCQFFCASGRPDTGTVKDSSREAYRNVAFICNASHLMSIAKKRLCMKAETPTREFVKMLREEIRKVDPGLADNMVPSCIYRGGICGEFNSCNSQK